MATKEWARSGSFMKKPKNGWLHSNDLLEHGDGVFYPVKYVGSIPMSMSMRTMSYEDRTSVTREAIAQVCEAAGLRPPRKRKVSSLAKRCLPSDPEPKNLNVKLTISVVGIALVVIETDQVIGNHIMPCISFATGGDATDYDVIGYVAKDGRNEREVHVFDCGSRAPDIITTIGQAFELRFKAYMKKTQTNQAFRDAPSMGAFAEAIYDEAGTPATSLPSAGGRRSGGGGGGAASSSGYSSQSYSRQAAGGYDNQGDPLYDDLPSGAAAAAAAPTRGQYIDADADYGLDQSQLVYGDAIYDNKAGGAGGASGGFGGGQYDDQLYGGGPALYDNKDAPVKFEAAYDNKGDGYGLIPPNSEYDDVMPDANSKLTQAPGGQDLEKPLQQEPWFHGQVKRTVADTMLKYDGEFLVRENMQIRNQFILSTLQKGQTKHLLLVDPAGRVRTKDMVFSSVSHLINYHLRARVPIISQGSRVTLGMPVYKTVSNESNYEM